VPAGRLRDLLICGALLTFGLLLVLPHFSSRLEWSPDGLFYQAQVRELRGEGRYPALRDVFEGAEARPLRESERQLPPSKRRVGNRRWVNYSSQFYRRRWTVPLAAAALTPWAGLRSLEIVSLVGIAVLAPLLYLLLLIGGFSFGASLSAAAFCAVLPPLLNLAGAPRTDSWGLALLVVALIAGLVVARRGARWLPLWAVAMVLLSFTRDETIVAITAMAWLALSQRSRRALIATGVGAVAALPALLLFSAPLKANLAYVLNEYRVPGNTSLSSIASGYPAQLVSVIHDDLDFPFQTATPAWSVALAMIAVLGLVALLGSKRGGTLSTMARGSLIGAAATILLSINYTELRIELVFVPAVAVGVALLAQFLFGLAAERRVAHGSWP
jgi:hypothetical protein